MESLFLSDMVGASGKSIDPKFLYPPDDPQQIESAFLFSEERPTENDWTAWRIFWTQFTHHGLILHQPLGKWIHSTHRQWRWFFNIETEVMERITNSGVHVYSSTTGKRRTRYPNFSLSHTSEMVCANHQAYHVQYSKNMTGKSVSSLLDQRSFTAQHNQDCFSSSSNHGEGDGCGQTLLMRVGTWRG